MGFFKTLFTGKEDSDEVKEQQRADNDFDVFKYDGLRAMQIGQTDYAIACYEHALQLRDDYEVHQFYANALLSKGETEAAIEQLRHMLRLQSDDIATMLALARLCIETGDPQEARELCHAASELDTTLAAPHYILASAEQAEGNLIGAIAEVTQAIAKREDFTEAYLLRAQILLAMRQFAEADADIDIVLAKTPDEPDCTMLKAQCQEGLGHLAEAKHFYQQTIDLNPFHAEAFLALGRVFMSEGDKTQATKMLEEAMRLSPEGMKEITGEYTNAESKK